MLAYLSKKFQNAWGREMTKKPKKPHKMLTSAQRVLLETELTVLKYRLYVYRLFVEIYFHKHGCQMRRKLDRMDARDVRIWIKGE